MSPSCCCSDALGSRLFVVVVGLTGCFVFGFCCAVAFEMIVVIIALLFRRCDVVLVVGLFLSVSLVFVLLCCCCFVLCCIVVFDALSL